MSIKLTADIPEQARDWRNHPKVFRMCRQRTLISEAHHNNWLAAIESDPSVRMFGIKYGDSTDIGVCGLTSIDQANQTAEFSLYIAPEHQGKKYAKPSLQKLFEVGFYDLNLNRIWGETFQHNVEAQSCFEKFGMIFEGKLRKAYFKEGQFIDTLIFSMLRGEYEARFGRGLDPGLT